MPWLFALVALASCGGAPCTSFTYSAWGDCQSDGGQTRSVLTSSPSACTGGEPGLVQRCIAPDGAGLYQTKCSSCHQAMASSNLKGKHATVTTFNTAHGTAGDYGLTTVQLQAVLTAVGP